MKESECINMSVKVYKYVCTNISSKFHSLEKQVGLTSHILDSAVQHQVEQRIKSFQHSAG